MKNKRRFIEVVNPRNGQLQTVAYDHALRLCATGVAYWTPTGKIQYRTTYRTADRSRSDVYVDHSKFQIYTHKKPTLPGGPTFPHKQWRRYDPKLNAIHAQRT